MSSKKKKILFRLIVLSVLMCVVLPLSVHAALVIGNEFGYGTYVGYWKSQADTVSPPGYLMDFMQYGGQTSVFTTLSTGEVFFGDFTLKEGNCGIHLLQQDRMCTSLLAVRVKFP